MIDDYSQPGVKRNKITVYDEKETPSGKRAGIPQGSSRRSDGLPSYLLPNGFTEERQNPSVKLSVLQTQREHKLNILDTCNSVVNMTIEPSDDSLTLTNTSN